MRREFNSKTITHLTFSSTISAISFETINDKMLFPELPHGPLDRYRKNAKFDYRKIALMLDDEKCLRFRVRIFYNIKLIRNNFRIQTISKRKHLLKAKDWSYFNLNWEFCSDE